MGLSEGDSVTLLAPTCALPARRRRDVAGLLALAHSLSLRQVLASKKRASRAASDQMWLIGHLGCPAVDGCKRRHVAPVVAASGIARRRLRAIARSFASVIWRPVA